MADDVVRASVEGVRELSKAFEVVERDIAMATRAGASKAGTAVTASVKKQIKGPPRFGERGKSRIYPETVHVDGATGPRGGGPGKFTGTMRKNVHRGRVTMVGDTASVKVTGSKGASNLYAKKVDAEHPFFKPGYDVAQPLIRDSFNKAYSSALRKYSGR